MHPASRSSVQKAKARIRELETAPAAGGPPEAHATSHAAAGSDTLTPYYSETNHTHADYYSTTTHTHGDYYVTTLSDLGAAYARATHTHAAYYLQSNVSHATAHQDGETSSLASYYAKTSHTHADYYSTTLHTHADYYVKTTNDLGNIYARATHVHGAYYLQSNVSHASDHFTSGTSALDGYYSKTLHTHADYYSTTLHTHGAYYLTTTVNHASDHFTGGVSALDNYYAKTADAGGDPAVWVWLASTRTTANSSGMRVSWTDASYEQLEIVGRFIAAGAGNSEVDFFFNGDNSPSYDWRRVFLGDTYGSANVNGDTDMYLTALPDSGKVAQQIYRIWNRPAFSKTIIQDGYLRDTEAEKMTSVGEWLNTTTVITRFDITTSAGGLATDSYLEVWGRKPS
ncbi:MAG: hypothetical protein HY365_03900 [Candidatus Aenigmarchaeota archaeon]|nr:hypothetical protein [Candidatus Aenigmarchaeota archaeon]